MNTFFFDDVQYPEGLFGGKDFFNPIIYSTEEREVGVWTDGKPLYQKTFDCGALLNAQTKEISFTEDMETATIIDSFAISTSEGYVISLPDVVPNYVAGSVRIYVSKTAKKIYIYSQADMRTYDKSYVTIQYTKTTDVAGSGSYNTLGVPNVHYSTDEQVIGTWIDGKPLYQKTYNINETIHNQDKSIDVSSLNIKKYINGYGTFMRNVNWASPIIYIETPFNLYESNINHSYLRYGKSSNTIDYGVTLDDNETATDITITIQYTKNID